jgi:hypothetical protein
MGVAIIAGHRIYFGSLPSLARLSVAWAHCALEHAAGAKLYNFNLGNVTAGSAWQGDIYVMKVPPPDPPVLRFRSFPTALLGAQDYWQMVAGHYRPALRLFDEGRAYEAAFLLGQLGYYTAKKEVYSNAVANWKGWFDRELAAVYGETLSEGRGSSLLNQDEIDQINASLLPLPPTIHQGSTGRAVRQWQRIVGMPVDGDFGPQTKGATVAWQRAHDLKSDGIVGPKTWWAALFGPHPIDLTAATIPPTGDEESGTT